MTVLLCILAALALILLIPVRVAVRADPALGVAVRYLFWTGVVLPAAEKPAAPKKAKKKPPVEKKKKPLRQQLDRYLPILQDLLPRCLGPVRRLLRRTAVARLELAVTVAGADAADTAVAFGRMNAAVYTAVAALDRIVTLQVRRIDITPDFTAQKGGYFFSGEIRLIPLAALAAAVNIAALAAVSAVKTAVKNKKAKNHLERDVAHGKQASDQ
jgi:hypothetical protein